MPGAAAVGVCLSSHTHTHTQQPICWRGVHVRAREWKGVAGMEEGKPGESLTLRAEGARPSAAATAAGEEPASLATPPKTRPPAPAPHRPHPAPRRRSGSPAGTSQPRREPRHFTPLRCALGHFSGEGVEGRRVEKCKGFPLLAPNPPLASAPTAAVAAAERVTATGT